MTNSAIDARKSKNYEFSAASIAQLSEMLKGPHESP